MGIKVCLECTSCTNNLRLNVIAWYFYLHKMGRRCQDAYYYKKGKFKHEISLIEQNKIKQMNVFVFLQITSHVTSRVHTHLHTVLKVYDSVFLLI